MNEKIHIYKTMLLWMFLGVILYLFSQKLIQLIGDTKNEYKMLSKQINQLIKSVDELKETQINANDYINILVEENNSLSLEIKNLQEENSKLIIAAETLKSVTNDDEIINNYAVINLTNSERDLLARILALEASGQPDVGQRAVVEVVFNRIMTGWASTVKGVIYDKGQFATVKYLDHPYAVPTEREYANIDWVLEHGSTILPPDYVYFATYKANGTDFIPIGDHYFARSK